jgi:hypothetical protein
MGARGGIQHFEYFRYDKYRLFCFNAIELHEKNRDSGINKKKEKSRRGTQRVALLKLQQ